MKPGGGIPALRRGLEAPALLPAQRAGGHRALRHARRLRHARLPGAVGPPAQGAARLPLQDRWASWSTSEFARAVDPRIRTRCIACPPRSPRRRALVRLGVHPLTCGPARPAAGAQAGGGGPSEVMSRWSASGATGFARCASKPASAAPVAGPPAARSRVSATSGRRASSGSARSVARDLVAVHVRQADVAEHDVGPERARPLEPVAAVVGDARPRARRARGPRAGVSAASTLSSMTSDAAPACAAAGARLGLRRSAPDLRAAARP